MKLTDMGATWNKVLRCPEPWDKRWSAFNPSICMDEDGRVGMLIRSSNYFFEATSKTMVLTDHGIIKNRLFFAYLNTETLTLEPDTLAEVTIVDSPLPLRRGVEDARLYRREGTWMFSGVVLESHTPLARLWEFKLVDGVARCVAIPEAPNPKRIEKNWMMPASRESEHFDYIYSSTQVYKDGKVVSVGSAGESYPWLRGGAPLVWEEENQTYFSIFHRVRETDHYVYNPNTFGMETRHIRDYTHVFVRFSETGQLVEISNEFVLRDSGIEYAAGLVVDRDKDELVISFGVWDTSCAAIKLPYSVATSMLHSA